jgi:NADH-quinone oxidoreductase subunit C
VVRLSDTATTANDAEIPALPGDGLRERIVDQMRAALGDALVDTLVRPGDDLWLRVRTDAWREAGFAVRDSVGCDYFSYLSGMDWLPSPYGRGEDDPTEPAPERDNTIRQGVTGGETRFQVIARVYSIDQHVGVTLKADVPDDDLVVPSWVPVYAGANWHEREIHEMFGIGFAGHNDLRNMYLPLDFEGYPLRKDYPLLSRILKPWPGIVDVEPLPGEGEDGDADGTQEVTS